MLKTHLINIPTSFVLTNGDILKIINNKLVIYAKILKYLLDKRT